MVKLPPKHVRKRREDRVLPEELEHDLQQIIYKKRPFQVGIKPDSQHFNRLYLWNRDAVAVLIENRLGRTLSTPCIAMYLERWGFPRMDHNQQPINRCTQEIRTWLEVNYPELENRAAAEQAAIYWICKRQIINCSGKQAKGQRKNWMISATNIRGKEHWLYVKGAYTEKHQLSFLKALTSQSRQPVFLIRDTSDYYNSSTVMYWLCENKGKIELFPPTLAKDHISGIDSEDMTLLQFYEKRKAALTDYFS